VPHYKIGRMLMGMRGYRKNYGFVAGGILLLISLSLLTSVKSTVMFVFLVNILVIPYYTVRYKVSSFYKLESVSKYRVRFLVSLYLVIGSFIYSRIFNDSGISSGAILSVLLCACAYIMTVLGIWIRDKIKPPVIKEDGHSRQFYEENQQGSNNNYNQYENDYNINYDNTPYSHSNENIDEYKVNENLLNSAGLTEGCGHAFGIDGKDDAEKRDQYGELIIAGVLTKLPPVYKVMNGVLLEYEPGSFCQIDHIIVSLYGVFVIECKHYGGDIYGKVQDEEWTQVLQGKNGEKLKYPMPNPVKQNIEHIKSLQKALTGILAFYHNIVVFTGDCKIEQVESTTPVVHVMKLLDTIRGLSQIQYLKDEQVESIVSVINSLNRPEKLK
jgi:predicted small secreted protein